MSLPLNVDIAEGFPWDSRLLELAGMANVCCGVHAGSPALTLQTASECRERGVKVGIHPGYPDPDNFGRRSILEASNSADWLESIREQVRSFPILADYVKPHGGFYNDTCADPHTQASETLIELLSETGLPLLGLPGTAHERIAELAGVALIREGFADRGYAPDGRLLPRSDLGGILTDPDEIARQVERLRDQVDTFCLHGDHEGCLERARFLRGLL